MHSKTVAVHHRQPKIKFHGIDSNKRLTKLFRDSLHSSWLHPYIRIRKFIQDYSLPVAVSAIFMLIVSGALLLRITQRTSLAHLLAGFTVGGQDYGTLLSRDKTNELKRNNDSTEASSGTSGRQTTPFIAHPNATSTVPSTSSGTSTGGGSSGGSGSSGGGSSGGTTPTPTFTASIASFQQSGVSLECTSAGKPKPQNCSKRYSFSGSIRTENGPGTVNYGWRSNLPAGTEDGSIQASSGSVTTPVQKSIVLACTSPVNFTMQLTVFSPTLSQSTVLNINHNCNDI